MILRLLLLVSLLPGAALAHAPVSVHEVSLGVSSLTYESFLRPSNAFT